MSTTFRTSSLLGVALLLSSFFVAPVTGASVNTDKPSYLVLQPVVVTYSGLPGNAKDWISIGLASDADGGNGIQYFYASGKTSGSFTFGALQAPGNYQVRVYYNNASVVQARASFTVTYPTPQLSTDKSSYLVLQPIVVTYSNMPGYPKDYITIVPAAAPDNVYNQYIFTGGAKSGTMTFSDLAPGNYEVRVHFNNDDSTSRARLPFTVSYPVPQISMTKSSYMALEKITVNYSNLPGYPKDYITLVAAGAPDGTYAQYIFTGGAKSGSMTFDSLPPGKYEARLHYNNDDTTVRARVAFTVSNPVPQVSTDKTSYLVLEKILVTYSNMSGSSTDFITLVPAGSKDEVYGQYFYTNGAKSGTMTFGDQTPGNYEIRVHFNDDNNVVYARSAFTVSYPVPKVSTDKSSYLVLEKITASYSNMPGYKTDFLTVVSASAPDAAHGQYFYTAGAKSGTMVFDDLPPGTYQVRAHFNDSNEGVYARSSFSVTYPNTTLRTDKTQYTDTEPIVVTYSNMPGYVKDYITVVPATAPEGTYAQFIFTNGARSGTMTFDPQATGTYEARVHYNNDDGKVSARTTFNVGAACAFGIAPSAQIVPAAGYSGSVAVNLTSGASTCAWQASTAASWLVITSGAQGTGNGFVNYRALPNAETKSRSDTMLVAGETFLVTQNAASQIQITSIANAASLIPSMMASGGIAQGAIFSILGSALGPGEPGDPATGLSATVPLAATLGNVSVQVTQGGTTVDAYPLFVWSNRIDAILPSSVSLGNVAVTVTYKDSSSVPAQATVVASNFGAFATNGKTAGRAMLMVQASATDPGLQNSNTRTARPEQLVTLIGTGLGAINAPDNLSPPPNDLPIAAQLKVLVGGKVAAPLHAARVPNQPGKDYIQFRIPPDAPAGCNVPVQIVTGETIYSNTVTISIDSNGQPCSSINPWSGISEQGGRFGNVFLLRIQASVALAEDQPAMEITMDEGLAAFTNEAAGGGPVLGLLASLPTLGTCGSLGGTLNIGSLLGSPDSVSGTQPISYLDAGQSISVTGPKGTILLLPSTNDEGVPLIPSMYSAILGGGLGGLFGETTDPPFLDPGNYTISGTGGKDIGAFSTTFTIPPPVIWTNRDALTAIDRSAGVVFNWSGGGVDQLVLVAGIAADSTTNATSGFVCLAPSAQGTLSVPTPVLANLSPTVGVDGSLGALILGTVPAGAGAKIVGSGLDAGMAFYGTLTLKTVGVK